MKLRELIGSSKVEREKYKKWMAMPETKRYLSAMREDISVADYPINSQDGGIGSVRCLGIVIGAQATIDRFNSILDRDERDTAGERPVNTQVITELIKQGYTPERAKEIERKYEQE